MKLMHTSNRKLSDKEFDILCHDITDSLLSIDADIPDIYNVHIDMISGDWHVEFVPKSSNTPVIKVNTYTIYDEDDNEVLKLSPTDIVKIPEDHHFKDYDDATQFASKLQVILDFLQFLYEFEYTL